MLALVLLMTPLWIFAFRGRRTNRERWAAMIKVFNPGTGTVQAKRVNGGFRGRTAALFYSYIGSKHEYVFFNIEVACSAPLGFSIHQPAAIEVGRAKNAFEIGDPGLDQSFRFSSDEPRQIRSWFLNPEVRSKFVALLYRGSSRCSLTNEGGNLTWQMRNDLSEDVAFISPAEAGQTRIHKSLDKETRFEHEREKIREVLEQLVVLASKLESGT